jgi:hydrogenase-4 component B
MPSLLPDALGAIFLVTVVGFASGAMLALVAARRPRLSVLLAHSSALLGGVGAALLGWLGLRGIVLDVPVLMITPNLSLNLTLTTLGAVFILLAGLVAIPAAIYALSFDRWSTIPAIQRVALGCCLNLSLLMFVLLPMASNALTFLLFWQFMLMSASVLITTAHAPPQGQQASLTAMVIGQSGAALLLIGFLLLASWTGSLDFAAWRASAPALSLPARNLVFILLALGFALQCVVLPFHDALLRTHAIEPGHIATLFSVVMARLGLYGFLLIGFDLLGAGPAWWGVAGMLAGAAMSVAGLTFALFEHSLKRLIAFVALAQNGIALIGIGAALLLRANGSDAAATMALVAALYHTLVSSFWISLLIMNIGVVTCATHSCPLAQLGGLIRRMPWTAALFLIGVCAGLPPLGGYIGFWLTFQALLASLQPPSPVILVILVIGMFVCSVSLTLAVFMRTFGLTFLGRPRSDVAALAMEAGWAARAVLLFLALIVVGLGLLPTFALPLFVPVAANFLDQAGVACMTLGSACQIADIRVGHAVLGARLGLAGEIAPLQLTLLLGFLLLLAWLAPRLLRVTRQIRLAAAWKDGRPDPLRLPEAMSTSFVETYAQPLASLVTPPKLLVLAEQPPDPDGVGPMIFSRIAGAVSLNRIAPTFMQLGHRLAIVLRKLEAGSVGLHLVYVLLILIALLLLAQ